MSKSPSPEVLATTAAAQPESTPSKTETDNGPGPQFIAVPGLLSMSTIHRSSWTGALSVGTEAEPDRASTSPLSALRRNQDGGQPSPNQADPLGGTAIPLNVLDALRRNQGRGQPLQEDFGTAATNALGRDMSPVRVHTDPEAAALTHSVQAVAFTHGHDIYFSAGTYRPTEHGGRALLAHELGHIGQETPGNAATIGRADDPAEAAADRAGEQVIAALRLHTERRPIRGSDEAKGGTQRSHIETTSAQPAKEYGLSRARERTSWGKRGAAAAASAPTPAAAAAASAPTPAAAAASSAPVGSKKVVSLSTTGLKEMVTKTYRAGKSERTEELNVLLKYFKTAGIAPKETTVEYSTQKISNDALTETSGFEKMLITFYEGAFSKGPAELYSTFRHELIHVSQRVKWPDIKKADQNDDFIHHYEIVDAPTNSQHTITDLQMPLQEIEPYSWELENAASTEVNGPYVLQTVKQLVTEVNLVTKALLAGRMKTTTNKHFKYWQGYILKAGQLVDAAAAGRAAIMAFACANGNAAAAGPTNARPTKKSKVSARLAKSTAVAAATAAPSSASSAADPTQAKNKKRRGGSNKRQTLI